MLRLKLLRLPAILMVLILSLQCQFTSEFENDPSEDKYNPGDTIYETSIEATSDNGTINILIKKHLNNSDFLPRYNDEKILTIRCAEGIILTGSDISVINSNILNINPNIIKVIFKNGLQSGYDLSNRLFFSTIESLTLPDNVEYLSDYSITSNNLKEINIGAGTNNITSRAFSALYGLLFINVSESNINYADYNGSLYTKDLKKIVSVPQKISGELIISSQTDYIFPYAISDCHLLTKVVIPSEVTQLDTHTIINCNLLTEIVLPDTINELKSNSFNRCPALKKLVFHKSAPIVVTERFFYACPINEIRVPDAALSLYKNARVWSDIKDNIFAFSDSNTPPRIIIDNTTSDLIRPVIEINNSDTIEVVPYQLYSINFDETTDFSILSLKTDSLLSSYLVYIIDSYNISYYPQLSNEFQVGRAVFFQCRTGDGWENSYYNKYIYREREIHKASGTYGGITPEKTGPAISLEPECDNTILYISPYTTHEKHLGKYLFFYSRNRM